MILHHDADPWQQRMWAREVELRKDQASLQARYQCLLLWLDREIEERKLDTVGFEFENYVCREVDRDLYCGGLRLRGIGFQSPLLGPQHGITDAFTDYCTDLGFMVEGPLRMPSSVTSVRAVWAARDVQIEWRDPLDLNLYELAVGLPYNVHTSTTD